MRFWGVQRTRHGHIKYFRELECFLWTEWSHVENISHKNIPRIKKFIRLNMNDSPSFLTEGITNKNCTYSFFDLIFHGWKLDHVHNINKRKFRSSQDRGFHAKV